MLLPVLDTRRENAESLGCEKQLFKARGGRVESSANELDSFPLFSVR